MTEAEKLQRDIDALRETIQRGGQEIASSATGEQSAHLRQHLQVCIEDLRGLLSRIDEDFAG